MESEFIHLHNHTDYSLLDAAQTVNTLVDTVSNLNMNAVGVTEHGNLFSAISFYQKAKAAGIKPVIGVEAYVAVGSRFEKSPRQGGGWGNNHLVLLAQNYEGYENLIKLITMGYLEGFYYRPRIDKSLLREYNNGIICLSACLKGEVQENAIKDNYEGAKKAALSLSEIFTDRFYLELQDHGLPEEEAARKTVAKLSRELNIPLVATNDAHYALPEHWTAHDIMLCLGTGKERKDPKRHHYTTSEFYLKSQDQMWQLFKDYPDAIENTRMIVDLCEVDIPLNVSLLPTFPIPESMEKTNPDSYLASLCHKRLKELYDPTPPEVEQRLELELKSIQKMGFAGYFLIVADFVQYAKRESIPVGPGRGSAAGSLVSYTLGITTIDPIKHNLLFERFLNPERASLPDIDIDFCYERRGEVIDYIKKRYGDNSVTQIITFGKLKARQVIRDVGRVLGLSYGEVDRIAKMIPPGPGITLDGSLQINPDLRKVADQDKIHKELVEFSKVLEGMNRHASTHAAGVVIAPGELTNYIPLYKSPQGDITSQYDMKSLESLGLLKMDFLGLRNLTVINQTVILLKEQGIDIDMDKIPLDDPDVYKMFSRGDTIGVFQFESAGMREYLKKLKPTCIEDLIAMNALYRPGPIENIDDFIQRKNGKKKIHYLHPKLKPVLRETYGIIVYQEQVMQIANTIAGFSLAQADIMRRAMGKKQRQLMKTQQESFIKGGIKNGISRRVSEQIYELIERFAQYGFNKSHSTAYAYLAYQTAYLKTHYQSEFMAANLTSEMSNTNRVVTLINECRKLKIRVEPPDINLSDIIFRAINNKTISFGLNAIKNVGIKALKNIIDSRNKNGPFKNIYQFCEHLDTRIVNKRVIESLIEAGTMDSLEGNRAQKYAAVDRALRYAHQRQVESNTNQFDLFGSSKTSSSSVHTLLILPDLDDWSQSEKLKREKNLIGFYFTGHPLLKYAAELEAFSNFDFSEEDDHLHPDIIKIGGIVQDFKLHYDKKNQQMAFFVLDCIGGKLEALIFHEPYMRYQPLIKKDQLIFIQGRSTTQMNDRGLKVIVEKVFSLEEVRNRHVKKVHIFIEANKMKVTDVDSLYEMAKKHTGISPLLFHIHDEDRNGKLIETDTIKVDANDTFIDTLRGLYGDQNVWLDS